MQLNKRLYNSTQWKKARIHFLKSNPLCVFCKAKGIIKLAQVVDHIIPHKGDLNLFYNQNNWQALCKHCHDSTKQKIENFNNLISCNADGLPTSKQHHWNN